MMKNFIASLQQGLNFRLAFAIAAGAFGSAFQHGYNTGVVNAPQTLVMDWIMECNKTMVEGEDPAKECQMSETDGTLIWSWIVGSFCVGGVMGGSTVGIVASRLGRYVYDFAELQIFASKIVMHVAHNIHAFTLVTKLKLYC